jgi:hypothetical protein
MLLLADKGYPLSPYVLHPFTEPEVNGQPPVEKQCRHKFNKCLSLQWITVEHAFGMLKGRFLSLRDLPLEQDIHDTYCTVEALFVLHNLCIDKGDCPEYIPFFDSRDPDCDDKNDDGKNDVDVMGYGGPVEGVEIELPAWETDEWLKEAG